MYGLVIDPKLYLLFLAAYVVGFVDCDDPAGGRRFPNVLSDLAFWAGAALSAALFVFHGGFFGAMALAGAWTVALIGVRRGILAQRNSLWETLLWTASLDTILARASAVPTKHRPVRKVVRHWQVPSIAELLPGRGRCMTIMGVAVDVAACLIIMIGLLAALR